MATVAEVLEQLHQAGVVIADQREPPRRTNADPGRVEKEMIFQKRRNRVVVGVPARLTTLSRHSGHGRVWTEVLDRLSRMTDLVVGTDKTADVWLDNGHEPDPEIGGPVVACAYEVSWGTPELDAEFPPETLRKLSGATEQAMARATHVVTGAHTSKKQLIRLLRACTQSGPRVPVRRGPGAVPSSSRRRGTGARSRTHRR